MIGPTSARAMGDAFADVSSWRKTEVSGGSGRSWLNGLVSADLEGLASGQARRSLLLSPTGGVRAEFTVAVLDGRLVLIQDPAQPRPIRDLLAPYVLSSGVELLDVTQDLALFAFPGRTEPPDVQGAMPSAPSCLGAGSDLIAAGKDHDVILAQLRNEFDFLPPEELEAWRVAQGFTRVGQDTSDEDLPQEARLEGAVSFGKGCFTGQEAVAKVRNLGHPRRVVLLVEADVALEPGAAVVADGAVAGQITSAAGTMALAKVRWNARESPLQTEAGTQLRLRD